MDIKFKHQVNKKKGLASDDLRLVKIYLKDQPSKTIRVIAR